MAYVFVQFPVFMLTDDHDLFENDEAHEGYISLPPEEDKLAAASCYSKSLLS